MNRNACIAIVICTALLVTCGVGVAAAAPVKLPAQYRVVHFDVLHNDQVVGKLSVNTNQWTFVMNAQGLEPGVDYYFFPLREFSRIGAGTANENGDLHLQGAWPQTIDVVRTTPEFVLYLEAPLGAWCVEPQITAACFAWVLRTTCWGTLKSVGGTPLPYQPLDVDGYQKSKDLYYLWFSTTTDADGAFMETHFGVPTGASVIYEGGTYNGIPYCSNWTSASYPSSIPL